MKGPPGWWPARFGRHVWCATLCTPPLLTPVYTRPPCSPDSTFAEVLDKLVHNRLHRVYICAAGLVPTGVVTLTDILRKLVEG